MKRLVQVAGLCCLLAAGGWGQRMGFGGFRGGGFRGGFVGGARLRPAWGFGGFRGGVFGRPFFNPFFHHPFFRRRFFISSFFNGGFPFPIGGIYGGYGYPFYGGGYSEPSYAPSSAPNVTIIYLPSAPSGGPEWVSGGQPQAAQPSVREYRQPAAAPPAPSVPEVYFQIAMKDGTIYSALAYWVDAGVLHFIDLDGRRGQVPVDQVDRQRSETLNKSRQIEFGLPAPR